MHFLEDHDKILFPIKEKSPPVQPYRASKWLSCSLLIDLNEMRELLNACGNCWFFSVSGVQKRGEGQILKEEFLNCYGLYVECLRKGVLPNDPRIRDYFCAALTDSLDSVYALLINEKEQFIKVEHPVVQLRKQTLGYSETDGQFREMAFGPDSIQWGIQFSFPQVYQDSEKKIIEVRKEKCISSGQLFEKIQKWTKGNTVPTPFLVAGNRTQLPLRLGKNCFSWINNHPQLSSRGIQVISPLA